MSRAEALYAVAAMAANILGALAVVTSARRTTRALDTVLAIAAGFLVSVALVDLLPDAIATSGRSAPVVALASYVLVHLTQHVIGRHFHFGEETHHVSRLVSVSALVGLLMHTFVDGVAVASGLRVSAAVGALVFIAVVLHKVPEGLAISSLFLAAGASRARALLAAGALGATTVLGLLLTDRLAALRTHGLAISAGVTLYVGASNLVPEFQARTGWRMPASFLAGCGMYFLARAALAAAA